MQKSAVFLALLVGAVRSEPCAAGLARRCALLPTCRALTRLAPLPSFGAPRSPQAAFAPHTAPRLATVARARVAPVMAAAPSGDLVRPRALAAAAAFAVPTLATATPALALDAGDLVLPVGGLTTLLVFVLSLVIGYTVLGDGPANPTRK